MRTISVLMNNPEDAFELEGKINKLFPDEYEISKYTDENLLISDMKNGKRFDIAFIDDYTENISIQIARKVNIRDSYTSIVLLCNGETEHDSDSILIQSYYFLTKPVTDIYLKRVLEKLNENSSFAGIWFDLSKDGSYSQAGVPMYIANEAKKSVMYFADGSKKEYAMPLSRLLDRLPVYFLRVHQSYTVNANYVVRLSGDKLILKNDTAVPVSRKYLKQLKAQINNPF